jgi:hypothetical protein
LKSNFAALSFERAIRLFQQWGFRVEAGPGREEVTLILEGSDHRSCYVYEAARLPAIAEAASRVRRGIGARIALECSSQRYRGDGPYRASHRLLH